MDRQSAFKFIKLSRLTEVAGDASSSMAICCASRNMVYHRRALYLFILIEQIAFLLSKLNLEKLPPLQLRRSNINHFVISSSMIKTSKLSTAIDPCVRIFQFLCFADFVAPSKRASAREKFAALWILIKYSAMMGILGLLFMDSMLGQVNRLRDSNGVTIHLIIYVATATEGFVTLLQALFSSSKSLKFMKRLTEVDELFVNYLSIKPNYKTIRRKLLVPIVCNLLLHLATSVAISLFAMRQFPNIWRLSLGYNVPKLVSAVFAQKFMFEVQLLTIYLDMMEDVLKKSISHQPLLVRKGESSQWKWNMKSNHFKVKVMQQAYRLMWEASVLINESFDVGLVDTFLVECLSLLYRGYTLCIDISTGRKNHRQIFSIFTTMFGFFLLHFHCQKCSNSVIF